MASSSSYSYSSAATAAATWTTSLKTLLVPAGAAAAAIALLVPSLSQPSLLSAWLKPPYLYIVINGIIITIAASSKLQYRGRLEAGGKDDGHVAAAESKDPDPAWDGETVENRSGFGAFGYAAGVQVDDYEEEEMRWERARDEYYERREKARAGVGGGGTVSAISTAGGRTLLGRMESWRISYPTVERPPVTGSFVAANTQGTDWKEESSEGRDTLDDTWRRITEGRSRSQNRRHGESDSWDNQRQSQRQSRRIDAETPALRALHQQHLEQGWATTNGSANRPVQVRKEPSVLSQDELYTRADTFIQKFKESMRLQRLKSLEQYKEMLKRGLSRPRS